MAGIDAHFLSCTLYSCRQMHARNSEATGSGQQSLNLEDASEDLLAAQAGQGCQTLGVPLTRKSRARGLV